MLPILFFCRTLMETLFLSSSLFNQMASVFVVTITRGNSWCSLPCVKLIRGMSVCMFEKATGAPVVKSVTLLLFVFCPLLHTDSHTYTLMYSTIYFFPHAPHKHHCLYRGIWWWTNILSGVVRGHKSLCMCVFAGIESVDCVDSSHFPALRRWHCGFWLDTSLVNYLVSGCPVEGPCSTDKK